VDRRRVGLLACALLAAACSRVSEWKAYFHDDPLPYYLYLPEGQTGIYPPPLFVGLLGDGGTAADCFDLWQPLAKERELVLICPELAGGATLTGNIDAEQDLSQVLTQLYSEYALQPRFFLAGFGDAGRFVLDYALRYPQVVSGVSVMAVDEFPAGSTAVADLPFLVALGETDRARAPAVEAAAEAWHQLGLLIRVVPISGDGNRPTLDFARLSAELCSQTARGG